MARILQGILGPLNGSIGPVTGYTRLGKPVIRSRSSNGSAEQTPRRQQQQGRLKAVMPFIKSFTGTGFFSRSFPSHGSGRTGYNLALGYAMNFAVEQHAGGMCLNHALAMVSRGGLPKAVDAAATLEDGHILFTWQDNSGTGKAREQDRVAVVAYCPETAQAVCSLDAGCRQDGQALLEASLFNGMELETWIGFINEEGTDAADSVYTGRVG